MVNKKSNVHSILIVAVLLWILTVSTVSFSFGEQLSQHNAKGLPESGQAIASACTGFLERNKIYDVHDCGVSESGTIGDFNGQIYQYALYCVIPAYSSDIAKCGDNSFSARYHSKRGLTIFVQAETSKKKKLFMERGSGDIGLYIYGKPEIVTHSFGTLLYVPIRVDGTGGYNESEYFIWDGNMQRWKLLDSKSWEDDLDKLLPPNADMSHGLWPDVVTMTVAIGLRRDDDPPCCPTGGSVTVHLTVKDDRFVIKTIKK